jgi:hypothetical protein
MIGLPRQAVWVAALAVLALALVGAYEGWRRSGSSPADSPATVGAAVTPTVNAAKTATALEEPEAPLPEALTEARVRTIVRQEIQAALNPQPAKPREPAVSPTPAPAPRPQAPADPAAEAALLSGAAPRN